MSVPLVLAILRGQLYFSLENSTKLSNPTCDVDSIVVGSVL